MRLNMIIYNKYTIKTNLIIMLLIYYIYAVNYIMYAVICINIHIHSTVLHTINTLHIMCLLVHIRQLLDNIFITI